MPKSRTIEIVVSTASSHASILRDRLFVHPRSAQRVLQLLAKTEVDKTELCALVELDPALSAAVLRAANSAHLGYSRRIGGIRHATVMLGGSLVASLAASRVADLVFDVDQPDYPDWLWQHSIAVACACSVMSRQVDEPADEAFTAGLLHDVGSLLAAANGVEHEDEADSVGEGADLLRRWNLPDRVVDGIRHHRARAAGLVGPIERLIAAASAFAAELGAPGPEKPMSVLQATRLLKIARKPDDVIDDIEDEITRRTAVVRVG
jgi:putative nucleotidyltransferase with HDIG domain